MGCGRDVEFVLAHADRLDDDRVESERGERVGDSVAGLCQPAKLSARGHGADEDTRVFRVLLHANAIAEEGAACEGRRGVNRHHRDAGSALPKGGHELAHQR